MKSRTTRQFRRTFTALPETLRKQARRAYELFASEPSHRSLQFKRVHPTEPVYSARINRNYRAVGRLDGDEIVWFWIGTHEEYERLLSR